MFLLLNNNRSGNSSGAALGACRKLNYAHDEEDLVEMANATEKIWWNTVAGRDSFFAKAFINEIKSLNL